MPFFTRDGLSFHYREAGQGTAVVFQHGLGGDVGQPFSLVRPPPGFRLSLGPAVAQVKPRTGLETAWNGVSHGTGLQAGGDSCRYKGGMTPQSRPIVHGPPATRTGRPWGQLKEREPWRGYWVD